MNVKFLTPKSSSTIFLNLMISIARKEKQSSTILLIIYNLHSFHPPYSADLFLIIAHRSSPITTSPALSSFLIDLSPVSHQYRITPSLCLALFTRVTPSHWPRAQLHLYLLLSRSLSVWSFIDSRTQIRLSSRAADDSIFARCSGRARRWSGRASSTAWPSTTISATGAVCRPTMRDRRIRSKGEWRGEEREEGWWTVLVWWWWWWWNRLVCCGSAVQGGE